MNANNQPLARARGTSTLVHAKFGPGMLLQHEDLEQLNIYTRELNRLMFRSLFGCGVVCGLVVGTDVKCGKVSVTVGSGLALDCQGAAAAERRGGRGMQSRHSEPVVGRPLQDGEVLRAAHGDVLIR